MKEEGSGEMAILMVMAEDQEGGHSGSVMLGAKVGSGGRSQAALWYRITELQQKEVLLTEGGSLSGIPGIDIQLWVHCIITNLLLLAINIKIWALSYSFSFN